MFGLSLVVVVRDQKPYIFLSFQDDIQSSFYIPIETENLEELCDEIIDASPAESTFKNTAKLATNKFMELWRDGM